MTRDPERRAELTEHLAELRARLIRSIIWMVLGASVAWIFYDRVVGILMWPMRGVLDKIGSEFLLTAFPEAFVIRMQISIVAGLILVSPLITMEIWAFMSPGLTKQEKRPLKWVAPLSVVLFAAGVALCYFMLPTAFRWFASYVPEGAQLKPSLQGSILFTVKMLLVFGLAFELPVFLMLLAKVGIVDSKMLRDNWRYATVAVAVVAAVATPSNDALTMLTLAGPLVGLYFLSIALVRMVEPKTKRRPKRRKRKNASQDS